MRNRKKLVIRKAGKEDLDKIKELFSSWGTQDWDKKSAEEYYDQYFTQNRYPDDEVFVGILGNEIVSVIGYCLEKEASGIYWLGWFYNHKLHTRQGYGGEMLDYVMKELKNKKARKLFAYTSTDEFYTGAQNLYLSRGFIKESVLKDFYEDGEDQIVFGLHLQKKATGEVFPVETLVVINWEKLTNWKDAYNKNDKSKDYGVYEILGWHTVFKDNALLYIGKASEQTFGKRISQETWLKDEWDLTIYLGRIQAINDRKQFSVSLKNNIISDVESLLIYFHSPPYNSVSISEQPKPRNDLRIINIGDSGALYTEISHKGLRLYK
jgi:Acetyltransferase (GNAT) family.